MSKKLIFGESGHPVKKEDFNLLQDNVFSLSLALSKFIENSGTFKSFGAIVTENTSTITWTEGFVFYLGQHYKIESGSISKTITFRPFWKIIEIVLPPSPTNYENDNDYDVHIEYQMTLVEEPSLDDIGIYDDELKVLPEPAIDMLLNLETATVNPIVTFFITGGLLDLVTANDQTITNSSQIQVTNGSDLVLTFSRRNTSVNAVYRIGNGQPQAVWTNNSSNNIANITIPNITSNIVISIEWVANNTIYNIFRTGISKSLLSDYISNIYGTFVEFSINNTQLTIGQENAVLRIQILAAIDIEIFFPTLDAGIFNDYVTWGLPTINSFLVNGVERKNDIQYIDGGINQYDGQLNINGVPSIIYQNNNWKIKQYKYYTYILPLERVAGNTIIVLDANLGVRNGDPLPAPGSTGSGNGFDPISL